MATSPRTPEPWRWRASLAWVLSASWLLLPLAAAQQLTLTGSGCLATTSSALRAGQSGCSRGMFSVAIDDARVVGSTVGVELGLHVGATASGTAADPSLGGSGQDPSATVVQLGLSLAANETFGPLGNVVFELDGDLRSDALAQLTLGARGVLGPVAARLSFGAHGADAPAFDAVAMASDERPSLGGASAGLRLGLTGRLARTTVLEADPEVYLSADGISGRLASRLRLLRALGENELRLLLRAGATPGFLDGYGAVGAGISFPRGRAPDLDFAAYLGLSPAGLAPGLSVSLAENLPGGVRAALAAAWEPYRLDVHPGRASASLSLPVGGDSLEVVAAAAFLDVARPASGALEARYSLPLSLP